MTLEGVAPGDSESNGREALGVVSECTMECLIKDSPVLRKQYKKPSTFRTSFLAPNYMYTFNAEENLHIKDN